MPGSTNTSSVARIGASRVHGIVSRCGAVACRKLQAAFATVRPLLRPWCPARCAPGCPSCKSPKLMKKSCRNGFQYSVVPSHASHIFETPVGTFGATLNAQPSTRTGTISQLHFQIYTMQMSCHSFTNIGSNGEVRERSEAASVGRTTCPVDCTEALGTATPKDRTADRTRVGSRRRAMHLHAMLVLHACERSELKCMSG
jgi:hypothetical protein